LPKSIQILPNLINFDPKKFARIPACIPSSYGTVSTKILFLRSRAETVAQSKKLEASNTERNDERKAAVKVTSLLLQVYERYFYFKRAVFQKDKSI